MERSEVYRLIDGERAYQQAQGMSDEHKPTEWLESIRYYLDNARGADYIEHVTEELRKVAALAVAALEQYGCPPREGYETSPDAPPLTDEVAQTIRITLINRLRHVEECAILAKDDDDAGIYRKSADKYNNALAWLDAATKGVGDGQ